MPFRASSIIRVEALTEIKLGAVRAKALAAQSSATMAAGNVSAQSILSLLHQIRTLIERWGILGATPGLSVYAQDQENDVLYDVVAEFGAMQNALIAVRDRIINELPKDGGGQLTVYSLTASGDLVAVMFTPAQTANLRVDLDAFVATVA